MKILIIKLSAIGDVVHTLPALNALRAHYPSAHITWVVEEAASDLVIGHRALNRVLVSRRKEWMSGLASRDGFAHVRAASAFIRSLRDTRYDLILDFHGLLKSSLLILLARGKRKIGFGKGMAHMEHSHLFLNERIPAVSMEHHALRRQLMLLESLGIRCGKIAFEVPIGQADRQEAKRLLAAEGILPGSAYAAVNPGAKWNTKLWHEAGFAQVADQMIRRHAFQVVFTGSREDADQIRAIRARMQESAAVLAGQTRLKVLGALYENAKFVLSTDTGPMHLAAAVKTPVIALFGPTAPWRTGPYGEKHRVIRGETACSPCFKRDCTLTSTEGGFTAPCMARISVQEVLSLIEMQVSERSHASS